MPGPGGEQQIMRAFPFIKSPIALDLTGQLALRQQGSRVHKNQAAPGWIGNHRQIDRKALYVVVRLDVEHKIMCQMGSKNQRRALSRQNQARPLYTECISRIHGV